MRSSYFYICTLSFLCGVLLASLFILPMRLACIVGVSTYAVLLFLRVLFEKKYRFIHCFFLGILFLCIGVVRYDWTAGAHPISEIDVLKETIALEGLIIDQPEQRAIAARFIFHPEKIEGEIISTDANILVTTDRYSMIQYGDRIVLNGKAAVPKNFPTDSGPEFDYVSYLAKEHIYYVMKNPKIKILSHGNGSWIKEKLFFIKNTFASSINRALPSPEDSFMNGILLGTRSAFSQSLTDDFVKTSTIHMVALSGYNVSIVADAIMKLFSFLPIAFASIMGIIGIVLFAILAGGGSTVIRASIMASLLIASRYIGREYDPGRILALAATVMVAINPMVLAFDVSFQLSFLATLGIVYLSPIIATNLRWMTQRFNLREIVAGTLAAQCATLPLIVRTTGIVSLVSLPANILVLPFVPITMLAGFLTSLIGLLSHILALPFSIVSYGLLHYMLGVVHWFASLPFAAIIIQHMPISVIISMYGLLVWWIIRARKK